MYLILLSSAIVFAFCGGANGGNCPDTSDCINLVDCPEALLLAQNQRNNETIQMFNNAFCGAGKSSKTMKFCCSHFKQSVLLGEPAEDVKIDNHQNQRLLPHDCGVGKGDRIFGGKKADLYEFPWMALISHNTRDGYKFRCGGTIINSRYVLTAAHCVKDKVIAGVRLGELSISIIDDFDCNKAGVCENFTQDVRVEKAIIHEGYQGYPRISNDIALLRLQEEADFSHKNIDKICLPKTAALRQVPIDQKNVTVTGWGLTENGTDFKDLLKVTMRTHSEASCKRYQNRYIRDRDPEIKVICAGELHKDSCNGDSGGPLMSEERYNNVFRFVQYGIVSNGPDSCGTSEPGIYTDVRKYMHWILDKIEP